MRQITQGIVPDGPLLCLEDDTLVPPNVWELLSGPGPHASGVQRGRYDKRIGVWVDGTNPTEAREGVEDVEACGMYCLLTTGEAYRKPFRITGAFSGAVDAAQTAAMRPRVVWDCICGHLTRERVLMPLRRKAIHGSGMAMFVDAPIPNRTSPEPEIYRVSTDERQVVRMPKTFRTLRRVVRDGFVQAGPKQLIPLEKAMAWQLCDKDGNANPNADYEGTHGVPYIPAGLERPAAPTPPEVKEPEAVEAAPVEAVPVLEVGTVKTEKPARKARAKKPGK